jgi:S1-C subfamily serine protease
MTHAAQAGGDPLRKSVVKLFTVLKKPNSFQPWQFDYQRESGGSACILEGNRILTNAHVVTHAVYVQVLKTGDTKKYTARVLFVDHERELALLTVDSPGFFDGTVPVRFGELPLRHGKVSVYGFPVGGNELSTTEGVVSRIEVLRYTHSLRSLLALQVDAAINPGNSGGPVFLGSELVGIAFQGNDPKKVEKSGHVVPVPILRDFLRDLEDGVCQGTPDLGAFWQPMESPSMCDYFRLPPDQTGVFVTRVAHGSSAFGVLCEKDVLTHIDGVRVDCDGSVRLRDEDRVNFSYLVSRHQIGDTCRVGVLRDGAPKELPVTLRRPAHLVPRPTYAPPTYFIFAGLVFMPLTYEYLSAWSDWKDVNPRFQDYYTNGLPSAERSEIVFINEVLAHDINAGYHKFRQGVVERVNDRPITRLADVALAFEAPIREHHVIEIASHAGSENASDYFTAFGTHIVLRADRAKEATREILARYGIDRDRRPG